jgi:voltage-gated potassium channel Kch
VLTTAILKGIGLFSVAIICARYVFPPLIRSVSKSQEVLFLTAVSTCLVFGILAHIAGFSIAIGGFLAGISLAVFPYNLEIISRVMPLRDFFATMFFVSLGMLLVFTPLIDFVLPVVAITLLIIIFKPFITNVLVSLCGYERRTAFISGLGLGQSSEFSLIIAFLGLSLGHVSSLIFSMVVIITIVTFVITTYFFKFEDQLYKLFSRFLISFENFGPFNHKLEYMPKRKEVKKHVIICGAHRMGHEIIKTLQKLKKDFLVVDYNPEVIKDLVKHGIHCVYGNVRHAEVLERLRLREARLIISTIPAEDTNLLLLKKAKEINPDAILVMTATTPSDALLFYENGADYVIIPKIVSGEKASSYLYNLFRSRKHAKEIRRSEIISLRRRKGMQILEAHDIAKASEEAA